jgi:hypothetical protein
LKEEVARSKVQRILTNQKAGHFFVGSSNVQIVKNWAIGKTV